MVKFIKKQTNLITLLSGLFIAIGFMLGSLKLTLIGDIFLLVATIIAVIPILMKAILALKMKAFSIELLVVIAVIGAILLHEYVESSVVTFLFLFGAYLEVRTLNKTRQSLQKLLDLAPVQAWVEREGEFLLVEASTVKPQEVIIIKAGEKVPVDGQVIEGEGSVNEAMLTGESLPVHKDKGGHVFTGTILTQGYLKVVAEKVGASTLFARIIELVEEAQETKTKAEKLINRFAKYYTPAILVLAIIVYAWTRNLHQAISFLVVACPGALVIGAPISLVAGIGSGARKGILFKGGEVMENFAKAKILLLDKTGTMTLGKPSVVAYDFKVGVNKETILSAVAAIESYATHPLAEAITDYAQNQNISYSHDSAKEIQLYPSAGVSGIHQGTRYYIGHRAFIENLVTKDFAFFETSINQYSEQGNTILFVANAVEVLGLIAISDQIRPNLKEDLALLRQQGIREIVMLTGDQAKTAAHIAHQTGIDHYEAGLKPEAKLDILKKYQAKGKVIMLGDGINDAPALAQADVGIAIGSGGTDIAMETADIVLMGDQFKQLKHAHSLSKKTMNILYQNLWIALITVAILLSGVVLGQVHLALGMFVHEASVLIVIINAMRLLRYRYQKK